MIIDFHTHAFPDGIAAKALQAMYGECVKYPQSNYLTLKYDGTLAEARRIEKEGGADYFVQLAVATSPRHQMNVNNFALKAAECPEIFAYGSIHGAASDSLEELERLHAAGAKGIKLHPDEQGIELDDVRLYPVYELMSELEMPCMIHAGFDPFSPERSHASPAQILKVHRDFPKLTMILAHLGGLHDWDAVEELLAGKGMWMDTSIVSTCLSPERAARIIRQNGAEQVLLGSDLPWTTIKEAHDYLLSLPLTDREKELIAGRNGARLLGIE